MFKWTIQKVNGQNRDIEQFIDALVDWLDRQKDGRYEVEAKRARRDKSQKQLGNIWGNIIDRVVAHCDDCGIDSSKFLDMLKDPDRETGVAVTPDFVKHCLYTYCPIFNEAGEKITLSKANSEQANKFINDSTDILCNRVCYIPEANPNYNTDDTRGTEAQRGNQ